MKVLKLLVFSLVLLQGCVPIFGKTASDVQKEYAPVIDSYHKTLWLWQETIFRTKNNLLSQMGRAFVLQDLTYEKRLGYWLDYYDIRVRNTLTETGMDKHPELTKKCIEQEQNDKNKLMVQISASHDMCVISGKRFEVKLNETSQNTTKYLDTVHTFVGTASYTCSTTSSAEGAETCYLELMSISWPWILTKAKVEVYDPAFKNMTNMVPELESFYTQCNLYVDQLAARYQEKCIDDFTKCLIAIKP